MLQTSLKPAHKTVMTVISPTSHQSSYWPRVVSRFRGIWESPCCSSELRRAPPTHTHTQRYLTRLRNFKHRFANLWSTLANSTEHSRSPDVLQKQLALTTLAPHSLRATVYWRLIADHRADPMYTFFGPTVPSSTPVVLVPACPFELWHLSFLFPWSLREATRPPLGKVDLSM